MTIRCYTFKVSIAEFRAFCTPPMLPLYSSSTPSCRIWVQLRSESQRPKRAAIIDTRRAVMDSMLET